LALERSALAAGTVSISMKAWLLIGLSYSFLVKVKNIDEKTLQIYTMSNLDNNNLLLVSIGLNFLWITAV